MRILGIDPGMAIVGYGLVEFNNDEVALLSSGSIQTSKGLSDEKRLADMIKSEVDSAEKGCRYLEKIVQCPYPLWPVGAEILRGYSWLFDLSIQ